MQREQILASAGPEIVWLTLFNLRFKFRVHSIDADKQIGSKRVAMAYKIKLISPDHKQLNLTGRSLNISTDWLVIV